jgi:hypothetical protein
MSGTKWNYSVCMYIVFGMKMSIDEYVYVCMHACMYIVFGMKMSIDAYVYVCMHVCMYVCI